MNLRFLLALLAMVALVFTSCDDDNPAPSFNNPTVTAPTTIVNLASGVTGQSVTFDVTFDSELTASYSATGSNVTISNPSGDVAGGSVTINFDAGTTTGGASITLTVTDSEGQSASGTAVFTVDQPVVRVTSNVSSDATWTADNTYILGGRIAVTDGATLTIEPGTVIKGEAGTGVNATALLVARGSMINAVGTASLPIIFTSVADEITPADVAAGNYASPNLDPDINGLWGGVIILGNAPISASNDDGQLNEVAIEGIPSTDPNGLYGGNNAADNSGSFSYVSIRHGGSNIGAGNEINGLTLGGVGSATTISNIEVVANQDDGVEWFGGTVSVSNVVVWNAGDDAIDTDQAWAGTLDNFVVVTPSGSCFELDGPEGDLVERHAITNGSVVAINGSRTTGGLLIDTDSGTPVDMSNVHFVGPLFTTDDDGNVDEYLVMTDDEVAASTFSNVTFDIDAADLINLMEQGGPIPAGISAGGSPQADVSVFGWTWANEVGGLDGL